MLKKWFLVLMMVCLSHVLWGGNQVGWPYVKDPDDKAVPAWLLKGPCGKNHPGYLHVSPPKGFTMANQSIRPSWDRSKLIPLPDNKENLTEKAALDKPFEPPSVRPIDYPAEVFSVETHPEAAFPGEGNPVAPQALVEAMMQIGLHEQGPAMVGEGGLGGGSPQYLPPTLGDDFNISAPQPAQMALLYYFQNNTKTGSGNPSVVWPFQLPVSGQGGLVPSTTNFSSATYTLD
jgi:hypothetical protein